MQELKQNCLLTNVNLFLRPDSDATLLAFLTNILPLLTGINSTNIHSSPASVFNIIDEYSELAKPLLQSTRILGLGFFFI
jgi:hypothetical protein